ncbi:MFS general substrate transporter [Lactarius deliciosus]|nr:MFS general substrate transporter [Lactarius deliciosus]
MTSRLVPTILNFDHAVVPTWAESQSRLQGTQSGGARSFGAPETRVGLEPSEQNSNALVTLTAEDPGDDGEFKLPKMRSLVIMLFTNVLLQTTFFVVVSSGSKYAEYLGGSSTFSGLVIGIPTVISGMTLVPLVRSDGGEYKFALHFILYALAYRAHFLYLILIGRIVMGVSFAQFLYTKRYCSDPRIVGTGWLVVGQSAGFTVGPFLGGVLYKVGFGNSIFNGYTSPGWVMAVVWLIFWAVVAVLFEDVPRRDSDSLSLADRQPSSIEEQAPPRRSSSEGMDTQAAFLPLNPTHTSPPSQPADTSEDAPTRISPRQWAVTATMCWFAMTCFFVLGAWESNIPIFSARAFGASPFVAGNLIALGGVCTFPFMFANVVLARRVQDRIILAVGLFASWFLVALGFNLASTVTLSLLSKQMPHSWNGKISLFIQYSNFSGRVSGAVWGGAGVGVGMPSYVGLQLALLGTGGLMFMTLWKEMKTKTG